MNVKISSRADKWAVHILNLLTSVRGFLAGAHVAREVPIFGDPFGTGDLFFGIIDELRFDAEKYSLGLVELKTRKTKRMPGKAQKKQHFLQVNLFQSFETRSRNEKHFFQVDLSIMPGNKKGSGKAQNSNTQQLDLFCYARKAAAKFLVNFARAVFFHSPGFCNMYDLSCLSHVKS